MDDLGLVLMMLGGVAALPGAAMAYIVLTDNGAQRSIHATPRVPVRAAPEGNAVKLVGRAESDTPRKGPFTQRDVVWYAATITETAWHLDGTRLVEKTTRHHHEVSRASFLLRDESGDAARIVLDGEEALTPQVRREVVQVHGRKPAPHIASSLSGLGLALYTPGGDPRHFTCTELFIEKGDAVVAIGPTRREDAAGSKRGTLVMGERSKGAARYFELSTDPESKLGASDRTVAQIAWALCVGAALAIGVGAFLFWS